MLDIPKLWKNLESFRVAVPEVRKEVLADPAHIAEFDQCFTDYRLYFEKIGVDLSDPVIAYLHAVSALWVSDYLQWTVLDLAENELPVCEGMAELAKDVAWDIATLVSEMIENNPAIPPLPEEVPNE